MVSRTMATQISTLSYAEASKALDDVKSEFETDLGNLQVVPEERYDEVAQLFGDHFLPDDPVCRAFGLTRSPLIDRRCKKRLESNISIMMVNKQTHEVMGVRISDVIRRSDDVISVEEFPKTFQDVASFFTEIQKDVNIFDELGADEIFRFSNLVVSKNYRQLGVGGQLMKASVDFARQLGFRAIKGEGDSKYAQKIYEKLGFVVLKDIPYDSYIYEGEPLGNRTGVHRNTKIYGKRL